MIRVKVLLTNPGQFFACCGLLELANRLWPATEGWFDSGAFFLNPKNVSGDGGIEHLVDKFLNSALENTMTTEQVKRFELLNNMTTAQIRRERAEDEKKTLEKLHRESPILLRSPYDLRIDWFRDDYAGGSRFKTWAGRQSVFEISSEMKSALASSDWRTNPSDKLLSHAVAGCGLPFNFDSDLGGQGSAVDVGFSFDPLAGSELTRIISGARPCLELLAFVGLQRFRPRQVGKENRYVYFAWQRPMPAEIAAPAACGMLPAAGASFEFRLLYRTKYLKSFLPAIPYSGGSDE